VTVPLIERYRDRLPVGPATPVVSLGEGSTPLLDAPRLSAMLDADVRLKWEGANPTGSFKDRGMTVAVAKALEAGARAVICASTGNTAASAAAYAARAGMDCVVLQPAGAVARGKLAQAKAVGAKVEDVEGSFDEAFRRAQGRGDHGTHVFVNSLNPFRLEGQKTAAFELLEELGRPPDVLALPYGGGGNTCAYALGFREAGAGVPRIVAAQSDQRATTFASAIRIAEPVHAREVAAALEESEGRVATVSDEEIAAASGILAKSEGVFCEPASAAGVAALLQDPPPPGSLVVCVITGHGLKDPDAVDAQVRMTLSSHGVENEV
jgi:threonine synthase